MRKKQLLLVTLACILLFPSFLSYADTTSHVKAEENDGKIKSKDEVVYATLKGNGELEDIYVVNTLDVAKAGNIFDYGEYSNIKNLTDLSKLNQDNESVQMNAPEGKFYYQGTMKDDTELPWDITITYLLDGQEISPSELAGNSGHLEINLEIGPNQNGNVVFYDNYLLQVSMVLPNSYSGINAPDGMLANAGENKQITFTVMPGQEEKLSVEADVENFEFQGIDIAAIPSTLPIDTSEMDTMTEDISTLSDAIGDLNTGVADLKKGFAQLNNGAISLRDGSTQYKNGINQIGSASSELVGASQSIGNALETISTSLSTNSVEMDLTQLNELPIGLKQGASGLTEAANGLSTLQENYNLAYQGLKAEIEAIPDHQLTEEEITSLYSSGADSTVLDKVLASYESALKVKATYAAVKEAFDAVVPSLDKTSNALNDMSESLNTIATELTESFEEMDVSALGKLQEGLATLNSNYGEFHSGLVSYTEGVSQLPASYNQLHSGIVELANGTGELNTGVSELHNGTDELHQETHDLPDQMEKKINEMIQEYDKSDFKPISFASSKNEKVYSVQFVIKTEGIEKEEQEVTKEEPIEERGFWDLLLDLFK